MDTERSTEDAAMIGAELDGYAKAVVDGTVPAGRYHRLACARHLRDRERERTPDFPFTFDGARAGTFFRFAGALKHFKGEWAGQPITLQPYQRFRLGSIFGWVHATSGLRRFRTAYSELPRKSGKSLEAAIVLLYATFADGEPGAEGYCVATKRSQARIVFTDAKQLVRTSGLKSRIKVQQGNLHNDLTASKAEPLGSDDHRADGLNPHVVIVDELHAFRTRGLLDVMESAAGARRQPLFYEITTAGSDPVSPCGDQHDYACKILDGVIADETFFAAFAHADPEDDWQDERTWRKANPNYGVSVNPDDMRALALKALHVPAAAAEFKQKRLNLWVNADQPWLSMDGWRRGQSTWTADDLRGESCWVGVDLASQIDLCAMVFVFPPTDTRKTWRLLPWVWTPADTLLERERRDRAPYRVWADQGHLIAVDGVRLNHSVIRDVLKAQRERYRIEQIGFDPWHADLVVDALVQEDGFSQEQVVLVPQTFAGLSTATSSFEAAVLDGSVDANGSPLVAWCASNVVVQRDGKGNLFPIKKRSRGRIDPIMAAIIGWRLAELGKKTQQIAKRRLRLPMVWTRSGWQPV